MAAPGEGVEESAVDSDGSYLSELSLVWTWVFRCLAVALGLFALWSAGPGISEENFHLGFYTLVTWLLTLLIYPIRRGIQWKGPAFFDLVLAGGLFLLVAYSIFQADRIADFGASSFDRIIWVFCLILFLAAIRHPQGLDFFLKGMAVLTLSYVVWNYYSLQERTGAWTETDFWMAASAIVLAIEVSRRGLGWWIPIIAIGALVYAHFGPYFPGQLSHRGSTIDQIVNYTFYSQEGIFGVMTSVMATYVLIFIYLGAFMNHSGMGKFFIDMPMSLAGRTAGGPAKVAVMASAVFGSISGSSLANIVSTGTFTIPLMKRVGFRPHVAGAVENSASLGGQLLPPVMGSGAFVMAEITGVPYVRIMAIAAVPALLYFLSIGIIVHMEAKKRGIQGMAREEIRRPGEVLLSGWFHLIPLLVLLGFLMVGYSPDWCAAMAIVVTVAINWVRHGLARFGGGRFDRPNELMDLKGICGALIEGTQNSLIVGSSAAAVGIIVGIVALTGLGLKMSYLLVALSGGSLLFALFLVAVASLVLGMALPITASYLVLVVLAGPALQTFGVPLIAAHMIVFWLSQDSNITPPVCLGAYVAASIAGADPWKTGWSSFRFAKMLYIMPLLFAYTPILMTGSARFTIWTMVFAFLGTIAFSSWTMSHLREKTTVLEWIGLAAAAVLCFLPGKFNLPGHVPAYVANIGGGLVLAAVYFWQRHRVAGVSTIPISAG